MNQTKTKEKQTNKTKICFHFQTNLQACVDVKHQTLIGIKLFDWDRTGDDESLGRFA